MDKRATSIPIAMCGGVLHAQPIVDIGLFPSDVDSVLEVRVCPTEDFDEVVSTLTFTIRWSPDTTAQMGARVNQCPSGVPISYPLCDTVDGYAVKIFNAFGTSLLSDEGCPWSACTGNVVMRLPLGSGFDLAAAELVLENYFISLNGQNATGSIYTTPCQSTGLGIHPGPITGVLNVFPDPVEDVILSVGGINSRGSTVDVFGLDGRCYRLSSNGDNGWQAGALPPGEYQLWIEGAAGRFIKE